jgi:RNA polymerase sigma-70 factor, ECF subfamily
MMDNRRYAMVLRQRSQQSDEDLMSRVARGDQDAFRQLASRYARKSFALAKRIAANDEDAEEIVQEAMIRVWTTAPRWRPEAAFQTWLYRIVINLCLNQCRRKPFAPLDEAGDPADPSASVADELERQQTDRLVANAIARLPERQQMVLILTYYEGFSNAETAEMMDTSVSSVESLLVRAKRALRAQLGGLLDRKIENGRPRSLAHP